jgi:single-stranded-DNA-specific exonuclease
MDIARRVVSDAFPTLVAAGMSPLWARIYAARGVLTRAALENDLGSLPSWTSMKGIVAVAHRLADAIAARQRLLIVADYDADGATACAVGMRGLTAMGADVSFLVPNRFEFGYGLTPEIVALAATRSPDVIITVDNGIASVDGVAAAVARGIDVVITDHHLPGERLPVTPWIVNPNQPGCGFPTRHLAGVGVMFYVLTALRVVLRERGHFAGRSEPMLGGLLDLVALGTVADVVRLDHVNRILVDQGLRRIRADRMQPGVRALFAAAGRNPARATTYDLGFVAGPRLNAAGRLADMSIGIACLLTDDVRRAETLAHDLDRLNRERRDVEASMQEDAMTQLENMAHGGKSTLCLYRPEWHQGVVGIVASRIKDRYHRPTVVFARAASGELRGSGRAITGFHLRDALDLVAKRLPGAILRFGGHAYAAGLSLREGALDAFSEAFERVGREWLDPALLARTVETDGELTTGDLTLAFAQELAEQVWGQGFPAPVFEDHFIVEEQKTVANKHLRLVLVRDGKRFNAMLFNAEDRLPAQLRAVYRPEVNHFQGLESLCLVVEHWQAA